MSEHNWAKICSEIVVAAYGTRIVGEKDDWPLCVYPLEECRDDGSGTLHTYYHAPVPTYFDDTFALAELKAMLRWRRGWVVAAKYSPRHRPTRVDYDGGNILAWVNRPPIAPNARLRKDSVKARHRFWWGAETLAIHYALMEEEE
jgi:hypothetical protein